KTGLAAVVGGVGGALLLPNFLRAFSVGAPNATTNNAAGNPLWNTLSGKPDFTVSPIGLANSGVYHANNGADFGPDTSSTSTSGVQEASKALGPMGGWIQALPGTFLFTRCFVPAPSSTVAGTGTIILQGSGMYNTVFQKNS